MKYLLVTFALLFPLLVIAKPSKLDSLHPGLEVTEYPRHEDQADRDHIFIEPARFGKAIGKPYLVPSLGGWKHETKRNAIAKGWLQIAQTGKYSFFTNSFYDRNLLRIDRKTVCDFADGGSKITTVSLEKGFVEIESVGYVDGRGGSQGIDVQWKPPGQREFSEIPPGLLLHKHRKGLTTRNSSPSSPEPRAETALKSAPAEDLRARWMTVVAKDFVIEVYKNGKRIPDQNRKLLLDRFGASVEQIDEEVKAGDWLVFHVAHNRLRHRGSKYFAVTGMLDEKQIGFVSGHNDDWSVCDSPSIAADFIRNRDQGTESRAVPIARPWEEGAKFMKKYTGSNHFAGSALWGTASSTWIKYIVPLTREPISYQVDAESEEDSTTREPTVAKKAEPPRPELAILSPHRPPVQIISAIYGTGGKNANVTNRVKELVEDKRSFFAANPGHLQADPNPYWNKSLHIVYMKDGVRREQRRNENEHILPESFFGPHDSAELARWIEGTRWLGPRGEIQFQPHGLLTGPGLSSKADWKSVDKNHMEISWSEKESVRYQFNYTWSGFSAVQDGKDNYGIKRK